MHKVMSDRRTIALLVVPGLLLFLGIVYFPVGMSAYYGMTDWTGYEPPHFIGLTNYTQILFHDTAFWRSLGHALMLAAATVFLQHPFAIFTAVLLSHANRRWEKLFRTVFLIPMVISVVVTAKMWASVFSPEGLVNKVLAGVGLAAWKQDWLGNPKLAIWVIIFVVMWQGFGYALLLYYAGLQGIPKDVYEAAQLDGADSWRLYTKVVVPMLAPVMRIAVVVAIIACLKQMETVFLMTNGGPGDATQFLGNYLYTKAFTASLYGYGNAISVIFVVVCVAITVVLNKAMHRDVGEF
ncbi:MAG TPA: sugar ABC transporter permease [Symbiobacteriaceae bacterium]|nr:sugar ABC transporter permease [Symbiobacteriaceae bacterium]